MALAGSDSDQSMSKPLIFPFSRLIGVQLQQLLETDSKVEDVLPDWWSIAVAIRPVGLTPRI